MSTPAIADGHPIHGNLLAVLDESSPANSGGGVAYVVTTAALFQPNDVKLELGSMFPANRKRPFHWAQEGIEARKRMLEIIAMSGPLESRKCCSSWAFVNLDFGAVSGFLDYLSGNVVELTVSDHRRRDTLRVMVDCQADAGGSSPGVRVRRFDDQLGRPDGDPFVIDLDDVVGISLY